MSGLDSMVHQKKNANKIHWMQKKMLLDGIGSMSVREIYLNSEDIVNEMESVDQVTKPFSREV